MPQREIQGSNFARTFRITSADVLEDGTIGISFSSETDQVERWFGAEVLSHDPGSVDMSRATLGLPFVVNHDPDQLVGRVEDISIGADKKGRGKVRFSSSAQAQQIRDDMANGIRPDISVGYSVINADKPQKREGKSDLVRISNWMPYEVTSATIPADISVGAGRTLELIEPESNPALDSTPAAAAVTKEVRMPDPTITQVAGEAAPNVVQLQRSERSAALQIRSAAEKFGVVKEAEALLDSDKPMDQIRGEFMELISKRNSPVTPTPGNGDPTRDFSAEEMGLNDLERKDYSFVRAINAIITGDWRKAGLERATSEALCKRMGRTGSFLAPTRMEKRAGLVTATAGAGGNLVATELRDFIDILQPRMKVKALGAQLMSGLQGSIAIPRQTVDSVAYWIGENPGADVATSDLAFDQVTLKPHNLMAQEIFSKQLLAQTSYDVEGLVRRRLAIRSALAWDSAAINGSGAANQPLGILNTVGIGSVAIGANGGAPTYANITALEELVNNANADIGEMAYLTTPQVRNLLKNTAQLGNTIAVPVWQNGDSNTGEMNGYRSESSTQVPSNLAKGTSGAVCSAAIFGVWTNIILAEWGALELMADPYTLLGQAMVRVVSHMMVDVGVEQPKAFSAIVDAIAS